MLHTYIHTYIDRYSVITRGIQASVVRHLCCSIQGKSIFVAKTGRTHNYMYTMWPKGIDANVKPDGTCRNHWILKGLIYVNNYIKRV